MPRENKYVTSITMKTGTEKTKIVDLYFSTLIFTVFEN